MASRGLPCESGGSSRSKRFDPVADLPVYFTIENGPFGPTDHRSSMTKVYDLPVPLNL